MDQARQWLLGALCHLGAGAKTNAGYGSFRPVEGERPALASPRHATFETTLELVTPAFLAGANQQAEDCDLRPATLRGLLRWWWRTMHAGSVDVATLQRMEAAIWGDTARGGAVRVLVERIGTPEPRPYEKAKYANMRPDQKVSDYGIAGGEAREDDPRLVVRIVRNGRTRQASVLPAAGNSVAACDSTRRERQQSGLRWGCPESSESGFVAAVCARRGWFQVTEGLWLC